MRQSRKSEKAFSVLCFLKSERKESRMQSVKQKAQSKVKRRRRLLLIWKNPYFKRLLSALSEGSELHYINGTDVLPPPLDSREEALLLARLGESENTDIEIRNILVERNLRLVVYIARRFENTKIGLEDLISIGTIGLMKAIGTFRADKSIKLATYASRCIENEILMFIRKTSGQKAEVSLDEPLNVDWDGNELLLSDILGTDKDEVHRGIEAEEERQCLYDAVMSLPPRDRQIICMRFGFTIGGKEMTQKEVADTLGISQSYISRLEKRIILKLREEIADFYS